MCVVKAKNYINPKSELVLDHLIFGERMSLTDGEANLRNEVEPNKLAAAMLMCQGWGPNCVDHGACQLDGQCFLGGASRSSRHEQSFACWRIALNVDYECRPSSAGTLSVSENAVSEVATPNTRLWHSNPRNTSRTRHLANPQSVQRLDAIKIRYR